MSDLQTLFDAEAKRKPTASYLHSEENRSLMSAAKLGKKRGNHTEETRAKMSANGGHAQSEETRAKISAARKGKTAHNKGCAQPLRYKPLQTPKGIFPSLAAAELAYQRCLSYYIKKYSQDYYYITKDTV